MLGNMNVFMAVLGINFLHFGHIFSHKWDD
ncbi:hypothetical protein ACLK14_08835 [Escherichia coli]